MTNLSSSRLYNFGDTFGDPAETHPVPADASVEGSWCNQADGIFEHDDAAAKQCGGR